MQEQLIYDYRGEGQVLRGCVNRKQYCQVKPSQTGNIAKCQSNNQKLFILYYNTIIANSLNTSNYCEVLY